MNASAPPRGHDTFEALAVAWALDSLEPADQVIFEEHRDGCAICERTVRTTLEVAAELAYGVPDIDPPPQLRRRILAAATAGLPVQATSPEGASRVVEDPADVGGPAGFASLDLFGDRGRTRGTGGRLDRSDDRDEGLTWSDDRAAGTRDPAGGTRDTGAAGDRGAVDAPAPAWKPSRGSSAPRHRRPGGARIGLRGSSTAAGNGSRRRRIVSVFAAAALVGLSAVTTWEVTRPAAVTAPVAAADRTATLSTPAEQGSVATVVVRSGTADVVTDALKPNAEGRQFYMWGVPAGGTGTPQVVGTFTVTTTGLHSYPVRLTRSLQDYPVLAISEEATGSSPAKPSGVLARGALSR